MSTFQGLHCATLSDGDLVDACLQELVPMLDVYAKRRHKGRGEMVEIGRVSKRGSISSSVAAGPGSDGGGGGGGSGDDYDASAAVACCPDAIKNTLQLIRRAMHVLTPPPPPPPSHAHTSKRTFIDLDRLNIIVRRYRAGEGLPFHVDYHAGASNPKYHVYDEPVYGCVLRNTSTSVLTFRHKKETCSLPERCGRGDKADCGDDGEVLVFLQLAPIRFTCQHGLVPLPSGERISLTWRWIAE